MDQNKKQATTALVTLLQELIDELKLGKTARLPSLIRQTGLSVAGMLHDLSPQHKATERTGPFPVAADGVRLLGPNRYIVRPSGRNHHTVEVTSPEHLRTEDRLVSDLEQIRLLCWGLQRSESDPQVIEKLELLATRVGQAMEGGKIEPASAPPPPAVESDRPMYPSRVAALESYKRALEANPELKGQSLHEVWRWLKEKDPDKSDYVLPREGTWARYVSAARQYFRGRSSGRSHPSEPGSFSTKARERFETRRRGVQP